MLCLISACWVRRGSSSMIPKIHTIEDVVKLFPRDRAAIEAKTNKAIEQATKDLAVIIALQDSERTFENTVRALDILGAQFHGVGTILHTLEMVSPDADLRTAAHEAILKLQEFAVNNLGNNIALYKAFKAYVEGTMSSEDLNQEERTYVKEAMKGFKKSGLDLPEHEQENLKKLKKELGILELQFDTNINADNRTITVTRDGLAGLSDEFIAGKKSGDNAYSLGVDYPTYTQVMENCSVEATRKNLWLAFGNRAHPANKPILDNVISLRNTIAQILGFKSYADLDIDDEMAENPENVEKFLEDLILRAQPKVKKELDELKKNLPDGVTLVDGKFKPWDLTYTKTQYKKKYFDIDERAISEYFPMEKTIQELLDIYEQFLNITFKQIPIEPIAFWHPDVKFVAVYSKENNLIGYLLLDLYPRDNKYSHACQIDIVPALRTKQGELYPAVAVVLANFPKPGADKPALLQRNDVITFFHEFGHAIHSLLGATQMIGFSGTHVKTDFVEMPSQMLEEWMWSPEIIKKVSSHFQTGEPLSDEVIQKIRTLKNFDSGYWVQRQLSFALLSLEYYLAGEHKDTHAIKQKIFERLNPHVVFIPEDNFESSFGHLMGYGAKYYGYLWSKVFALDLFDYIQQYGLLNADIGTRYVQEILSKGGSLEPQVLLKNFLGREPKSDAFFADLGL